MFSRISQADRYFVRPLRNYSRLLPTNTTLPSVPCAMTSSNAAVDRHTRRTIHTAGCLVIGDEILGGKTADTNSSYMAKFCFSLGMNLKRIQVVGDDEDEIIDSTRQMSEAYDFVITSGGIGPTHDDITYESMAKAFGLQLKLHEKSLHRMKRISEPQADFSWDTPSPALDAKLRMVRLPLDESKTDEEQVLFVKNNLWVPITVVNGNVHILPGIPRLFESLLDGMRPILIPRLTDPEGQGIHRLLFSTPMTESAVAAYLTELAAKVEPRGIKVGSYPRWGKKRNTVTLVGRDHEYMDGLIGEVEKGVQGKRVVAEGEDDTSSETES